MKGTVQPVPGKERTERLEHITAPHAWSMRVPGGCDKGHDNAYQAQLDCPGGLGWAELYAGLLRQWLCNSEGKMLIFHQTITLLVEQKYYQCLGRLEILLCRPAAFRDFFAWLLKNVQPRPVRCFSSESQKPPKQGTGMPNTADVPAPPCRPTPAAGHKHGPLIAYSCSTQLY